MEILKWYFVACALALLPFLLLGLKRTLDRRGTIRRRLGIR